MIRRRLACRIALSVLRVGMLLWIWSMFSRIHSISRIELAVGLVVMTVGWQVTSMWADRVVSEWWERRKRSSSGRVFSPVAGGVAGRIGAGSPIIGQREPARTKGDVEG